MTGLLGRMRPIFYAVLRIVAGLLFMQHGLQKMFGLLGGRQMEIMSQLGLAGIIELAGGVFIALGLSASPVAFVASGEMAWAYIQMHAPRGLWPIQNGGEVTLLYLFLFLYVAATGSGRWSLDAVKGFEK